MGPKKKKPNVAQKLIDSLLDDRGTPSGSKSTGLSLVNKDPKNNRLSDESSPDFSDIQKHDETHQFSNVSDEPHSFGKAADSHNFGKASAEPRKFSAEEPILLEMDDEESIKLVLTNPGFGKNPQSGLKKPAAPEPLQVKAPKAEPLQQAHAPKLSAPQAPAQPPQAPKQAEKPTTKSIIQNSPIHTPQPIQTHQTKRPNEVAPPPPSVPSQKVDESTMRLEVSPAYKDKGRPQQSRLEEPKMPTSKHEPTSVPAAKSAPAPASAPVARSVDEEDPSIDRFMPTEVKTIVRKSPENRPENRPENKSDFKADHKAPHREVPAHQSGMGFSSAEAALKQSESLRIAQTRITDLENELERVRRENEQLSSAGETLRRKSDELLSKAESLEIQKRESEKIFDEEKKVFRGQSMQKDREVMELRSRLEEMEGRLESSFKKIRVRERELEHRLEIIKMESATLVSAKDKMILELKRQIDQLAHENDYGKQKSVEMFNQYKEKQETIRRVVRALRIALTILEGDEDGVSKKAE